MLSVNPEIGLAANGKLSLQFSRGDKLAHTIVFPCDANGLRLIRLVLVARERGETRFGQAGNPTQTQIEQWLKNAEFEKAQKKIADEKLAIEELTSIF